jgi:hypothetical protein
MQIKTTWAPWHHLDIGMVTHDGAPVRAVVYAEGGPVGVSYPTPEGWSPCAGTSANLPVALARMEGETSST